jgi:signal transduction histidine kinase
MIYIILCVILIFSLIILITFQLFVYFPLRKITEAATQYAGGNLDYHIPVDSEDEIGYLSASLNFMADHLKNMQDYQKQFIGNISHDFRSPLTSIKGYVEAIADGTIPPEMQQKYLKIILFETERLTDLTSDLLTLNQFDTNKIHLNRTVFDLHEVIKNTVASFEGVCTTRLISFDLLLAVKELRVYADKGKIQQVVYNLIDNAIKFSGNNTIITIETTDRSNSVLVSIRDNGIGIPKQSLPKIWDRFYKSDLSRGKDKKGTGLGLAIVKEIIQAHNENIHVVSTEGVGTEFSFTLSKPQKGSTAK